MSRLRPMASRRPTRAERIRRSGCARLVGLTVGLAMVGLEPAPAEACGPHFDSPHLAWLGVDMLDSPRSHFASDLAALIGTVTPRAGVRAIRKTTPEGDAEDLRAALGEGPDTEAIVTRFLEARRDDSASLPEGLPAEFVRYTEAVRQMRSGDIAGARAGFASVLELPVAERSFRSTWAAYMVARMLEAEKAPVAERIAAYDRVGELVSQGAVDTTGLAAASLYHSSWQRRAGKQWTGAVESCLEYRASGGTRGCVAFDHVMRSLLAADPDTQREAIQDSPLTATLVAAWLTSGPHGQWEAVPGVATEDLHAWYTQRWLDAAGSVPGGVGGADRLGWAAYQAGAFDEAARWVARAPDDAPVAHWIAGKLALRAGDLPAAIEALDTAATAMAAPEGLLFSNTPWRTGCTYDRFNPARAVLEELGVAQVAAGRYEDALVSFSRSGDWVDAAWVAERLLTTDALQQWVDQLPPLDQYSSPSQEGAALGFNTELSNIALLSAMNDLLARRLMRVGRFEDAQHYFVGGRNKALARELATLLAQGDDPQLSEAARGESLWAAAEHIKRHGWDLYATELEPDYRALAGVVQGADTARRRLENTPPWRDPGEDVRAVMHLLAPSPEEQALIAAHAPPVDLRYHFVYTAQDVAWRAVQLLPSGHRELVDALCVAGGWTRVRDPERADRFWQLLYDKARQEPDAQALLARGWWPALSLKGRCQVPVPAQETGGGAAAPPAAGLGWGWLLGLVGLVAQARRRRGPHAIAGD